MKNQQYYTLPKYQIFMFKKFWDDLRVFHCYMPCQPDMTRHTTRCNWVGPTLFIVEITPSMGSPDLGYSQKQNNSDLHAGMRPCSGRAKVMPRRWSAWRTRNWAKQTIVSISLCKEKKIYSRKLRHMSTQSHKLGGPSQGCDKTNGQGCQKRKIAGKIIIKEERTWKVS